MPVANAIDCSRLAIGLLSLGQAPAQMWNPHVRRALSKGITCERRVTSHLNRP